MRMLHARMVSILALALILTHASTGSAIEVFQPGVGWYWQPNGWNYSTGDYVWAPDTSSWLWVQRAANGPWTCTMPSSQWTLGIRGGWNYFSVYSTGSIFSDYYYYSATTSSWYYLYNTEPVWYYNLTWDFWGVIH